MTPEHDSPLSTILRLLCIVEAGMLFLIVVIGQIIKLIGV